MRADLVDLTRKLREASSYFRDHSASEWWTPLMLTTGSVERGREPPHRGRLVKRLRACVPLSTIQTMALDPVRPLSTHKESWPSIP